MGDLAFGMDLVSRMEDHLGTVSGHVGMVGNGVVAVVDGVVVGDVLDTDLVERLLGFVGHRSQTVVMQVVLEYRALYDNKCAKLRMTAVIQAYDPTRPMYCIDLDPIFV